MNMSFDIEKFKQDLIKKLRDYGKSTPKRYKLSIGDSASNKAERRSYAKDLANNIQQNQHKTDRYTNKNHTDINEYYEMVDLRNYLSSAKTELLSKLDIKGELRKFGKTIDKAMKQLTTEMKNHSGRRVAQIERAIERGGDKGKKEKYKAKYNDKNKPRYCALPKLPESFESLSERSHTHGPTTLIMHDQFQKNGGDLTICDQETMDALEELRIGNTLP
jgi:hypothetical protein